MATAQCYPLYYFVPSITRDGRFLVYHRSAAGQLQLYRLDLRSAESVQLTHATGTDTQWRPWCVDSGRGVLDHRSVLNVARGLVVYFDGDHVQAVEVATLQDRVCSSSRPGVRPTGRTAARPTATGSCTSMSPADPCGGNPAGAPRSSRTF